MPEVVIEERFWFDLPDISHLETENDDPVDNISLHSFWVRYAHGGCYVPRV